MQENKIQAPLIEKGANPSDQKSESKIESNQALAEKTVVKDEFTKSMTTEDLSMVNVFDQYQNHENMQLNSLPIECSVQNICITNDSNALFIDKNSKILTLFGLELKQQVLSKALNSYNWYTTQEEMKVSRIIADLNGKYYYIGFQNGLVVQLLATDLSTVQKFKGSSKVLDIQICANFMAITYESGIFTIYQDDLKRNKGFEKYFEDDTLQYPLICCKFSFDKKYFIVYCENRSNKNEENLEIIYIYDLQHKNRIKQENLDLNDKPELKEDPQKLFLISPNGQFLALRTDDQKGLKFISLLDGTLISEIKECHKRPITCILFIDDNKILTSSRDKKICCWNVQTQVLVKKLDGHTETIEDMVLSQDLKFLFTSGGDKQIILWYVESWKKLCQIACDFKIRNLQISNNQSFLIVMSQDNQVSFCKIQDQTDQIVLNFGDYILSNSFVTPNKEILCIKSTGDDMEVWNLVSNVKMKSFDFKCEWNTFQSTKDSKFIFMNCEVGKMLQWNTQTSQNEHIYDCENEIMTIIVTNDDNYIVTNTSNGFIFIFDLVSKQELSRIKLKTSVKQSWHIFKISQDDNYAIVSQSDGCYVVVDISDKNKPQQLHYRDIIDYHSDTVCGVDFFPKNRGNLSFIGYCGNGLLVYDYILDKVEHHMNGSAHFTFIFEEGNKAITSTDKEIVCYDTNTWSSLWIYEEKNVPIFGFHKSLEGIIVGKSIKFWSKKLVADLAQEDFNEADEEDANKKVDVDNKGLQVVGPLNHLFPDIFKNFIQSQTQSKKMEFIKPLLGNKIMPQNLNILHYFSFQNKPLCVEKSLNLDIKYLKDKLGNTPLLYALKRNSYNCVGALLDFAMKSQNMYQNISQQEICYLIEFSPENLSQFFENSLAVIEENVPPFGIIKDDQEQIFILESERSLSQKQLMEILVQDQQQRVQEKPLFFQKSKFLYNFEIGSASSIAFHQALKVTKQNKVFSSQAIQLILEYKWAYLQKQAIMQTFIFILLLVSYVVHCQSPQNILCQILLYILVGLHIVFEFIEMSTQTLQIYFSDSSNYTDLVLYASMIGYFVFNNLDADFQFVKETRALIMIIAWQRFFNYLMNFESSRIFINLIYELILDLQGFSIILVTYLFAFTTTQWTLLKGEKTFLESLLHQYQIMLGDFATDEYTEACTFILYGLSTILMTIVMLNLVIAIMGDTYGRVMTEIKETDGRQLNQLILNQESLYIWKRQSGKPTYIYNITYSFNKERQWQSGPDFITSQLEGTQSKIQKNIFTLQNAIQNVKNEQENLEKRIVNKFDEAKRRQDLSLQIMKEAIQSVKESIQQFMQTN